MDHKRIHFIGIAGTGMGSFAALLKAQGHTITGSDENVYPPMSDMLAAEGIAVSTPYAAENLARTRPELVVVGNVVRRENVEATAVREQGLPALSFPQALGEFFLKERTSLVVAGTHGKTTTSAMLAQVLVHAGRDPSFLIGGVSLNQQRSFGLGAGREFVVEGDEYDSAYFDKRPKFLHYHPQTLIITSVEFDHADIYRDLPHYESAFAELVTLVPANGVIAVCADWPSAVAMARQGRARVVTYSVRSEAELTARPGAEPGQYVFARNGKALATVNFPLLGLHNVANALAVWAAAESVGLSPVEIAQGLSQVKGVRRRQEVVGEVGGVMVVDDFAHHPTAVEETIAAFRLRYPQRRLWAIFEPRSNTSRRDLHRKDYVRAFGGASRVTLLRPAKHDRVPEAEALAVDSLVAELHGSVFSRVEEIVAQVAAEAKSGDIILAMSNGAFGGFHKKLLERLAQRGGA